MNNLYHHSKKDFQVERVVLFSDAVFAIAITLLIIELKVPEIHGASITEHSFFHSLLLLLPQFFSFVLSFFIIGLYWFIHHKMFGHVINYTNKLIWLNLVFLFSVVLMPFTTAIFGEYSKPGYEMLLAPYGVYVFNICLTGFLNFLLWSYIGNPKNEVTEDFPQGDFLVKAKIRSLLLPFIFIMSFVIGIYIHPIIGKNFLFLTPLIMSLVRNKKTLTPKQHKRPEVKI
jgi:uncharacterized membrane protein